MKPYDSPMESRRSYLEAAREVFAGTWDIHDILGILVAVPSGTPVISSTEVDDIVHKVRMEVAPAGDHQADRSGHHRETGRTPS